MGHVDDVLVHITHIYRYKVDIRVYDGQDNVTQEQTIFTVVWQPLVNELEK